MHDPQVFDPPPGWRRALAWLTRSKIRPAPPGRVVLKRVGDLDELDEATAPAWLCIHTKTHGELGGRRPMPMLVCPSGHRFVVAGGHSVGGTTGDVDPQVGCPECDWLALVTLDGWAPA